MKTFYLARKACSFFFKHGACHLFCLLGKKPNRKNEADEFFAVNKVLFFCFFFFVEASVERKKPKTFSTTFSTRFYFFFVL
jgi:hypothetical protein